MVWQYTAVADEWTPPKAETYYSANRQWRLTVMPRAMESPLAYYSDKVADHPNPGAPPRDAEQHARGFMEHLSGRVWALVWNVPLVNEISPANAIVSNRGAAATFGNWGSVGFGDDAVVIYDNHGQKIRNLALKDFLPKTYIHALPRSVSSIWWGGDHHFSSDGKWLILRVVVPSTDQATTNRHYVDIIVNTKTGQVTPPEGPTWNRAMQAAVAIDVKLRKQEAAEIAFLNSPLRAPATHDVTPWYRYLVEAFFRLDQNRADGYPETKVLPLRRDSAYPRLLGYLRDTLEHPIDDQGAIMLASPDQTNLVHVIGRITSKLPPDKLHKARIYVTVTPALQAVAAKAIARTGATFIPLDVTRTIPPRKPLPRSDAGSH